MHDQTWLAERFDAERGHLNAVAYRMLGSRVEAEDAVQEAWFRLSRADTTEIHNLGGWLTTVVARVCLDMLRARSARREEAFGDELSELLTGTESEVDPEREALLADAVGPALLVVLETLAPAERLAFVLHDMFAVPFDEIAEMIGRSPAAARQLASRARRRVQGNSDSPAADLQERRAIVDAFLAAARDGDFSGLLALLDPGAVLRGDDAVVSIGAIRVARGAHAVAEFFAGRARAAVLALVSGDIAAVWAYKRRPRVVFDFTIANGKIMAIDLIADPELLADLDWKPLPRRQRPNLANGRY